MNKQKYIKIRLFDSFAGIGALHKALKNIGIEVELIGMSEIDVDAIISYSGVHKFHDKIINFTTKEEMVKYLEGRNIGYDFKKGKNKAKSLRLDKLKKVYEASVSLKNYGDISIIDPNELPDFDLFNFSFPCFTAGTLVLTDKGYKPIEGIKQGDKVLTHTNKYQTVVKPMINKANLLYRLSTMCSEDLLVTENHPFYVRERKNCGKMKTENMKEYLIKLSG